MLSRMPVTVYLGLYILNVKGATTSEGRILCWLKSGSGDNRPTLIESPDDLFKLGLDQVDYKEFGLGDYVFPSTN